MCGPGPAAHAGGSVDGVRFSLIERFADGGDRAGALAFRGGLVLAGERGGPAAGLGGLSGLTAAGDGTAVLAVSDLGDVLAVCPAFEAGRLVGLACARVWRRKGPDGAPVDGKVPGDAEAVLALPGDGGVLVAVERGRALLLYPPEADGGLAGVPLEVRVPDDFAYLVRRGGLEALALAPPASPVAGDVLVFHEKVLNGEALLRAWRARPAGRRGAFRFTPMRVRQDPGWDVTGATFLPAGDLLLLERRYRGGLDFRVRVRRIGRETVGHERLDGPVIMEAGLAAEIDNLEGIALVHDDRGEPVLLMVSDDNRSFIQRTLLLAFALAGPVPRERPAPD